MNKEQVLLDLIENAEGDESFEFCKKNSDFIIVKTYDVDDFSMSHTTASRVHWKELLQQINHEIDLYKEEVFKLGYTDAEIKGESLYWIISRGTKRTGDYGFQTQEHKSKRQAWSEALEIATRLQKK